jgi:uncharacterized membrane protein HdeD (DUF308 family)
MLALLAANWWLLLIRGMLAITFGILAILLPGLTLAAMVLIFGAFVFADGIVGLIVAIKGRGRPGSGGLLFKALLSIAAGVVTFFYPGLTAIALLAIIAAWAMLVGAMEIATAFTLRKELSGEWALYLAGSLSILFGVLMMINPAAGALAVAWLIGVYAMIFGVTLVVLAMRLRQLSHEIPATA